MVDKKAEILRCGKELFIAEGFKKTNVANIMKKANLGTGTFYNYYSSKDELFMAIFLDENVKLKQKILSQVDLNGEPIQVMNEVIRLNFEGMNANPILREWYNHDTFHKIEQNYTKEKGLDRLDFLYDCFIDIVKRWQDSGKMRKDLSAEMIMAIFAAIINIDTHKDEIGFQYFPALVEHISQFIMSALTKDDSL